MSAAATEDLRDLIRRMCAYNRDYRPSAVDCARDLEQLLYAIERRYHINIEEFARSTVLPIYETRQRSTPEDSAQQEESDEFLKEVTGAITTNTPRQAPRVVLAPYVFVGLLGVVVVALGILALIKAIRVTGGMPGTVTSIAEVKPPNDDKVRIELWIPGESQARVGDVVLQAKGMARIDPGPSLLELTFDDGRRIECAFEADEGTSVRWVGNNSVSIDDGDAVPCQMVRSN